MERINALMPAYNTAEFVQAALSSIYDFVDEIVVVEGGWSKDADIRSPDKTWQLILDFPDPSNKIKKLQFNRMPMPELYPFVSEQHKNKVMQFEHHLFYNGEALRQQLIARDFAFRKFSNPTGWLFFVDSDEVYDPESLEGILELVEDVGDEYNSFTFWGKNFYFGYRYYAGEYYQRIIKIPPPNKRPYISRTCCLNCDGDIDIKNLDIPDEIGFFYHYGYVGKERVRQKLTMWDRDLVDKWFMKHDDLWSGEEYDGKGVHLLEDVNPVYRDYRLKEFSGDHPDLIMRRNIMHESIKEENED
jgi:glycosyltransferase involved in cell wall biosynthesis